MNGSFGVEKSPHLLMAFTISKLKWLYHINSGTTKVYSSPRRAMGGDKTAVAVCLCNSATYERGSLNGARRAGLCLIFEGCCCLNKPPCVPCNTICLARNVGRGSTPSQLSYRFGAAFFFFFLSPLPPPPPSPAIGFCVDAACKRLTSYLEHPERMAALLSWLLLFFPSKFKVARLFLHVVKKVSCLWLCLYAALNFPTSLAPPNSAGDSMAWKVAEVCPAGLWFKKNFQQQLMLKTQSLLLDNELNLTRNATNGTVSVFSTHAVNRIFKQAEPHMFRIC